MPKIESKSLLDAQKAAHKKAAAKKVFVKIDNTPKFDILYSDTTKETIESKSLLDAQKAAHKKAAAKKVIVFKVSET